MGEKLFDALFVSLTLEVDYDLEVTAVVVSVGAFQKHFKVVYRAVVPLANIDHDAGIFTLGQNDFPVFVFRLNLKSWLCYQQFLEVNIAAHLYD